MQEIDFGCRTEFILATLLKYSIELSSTCFMSRPLGFALISVLVIPTIIAALIGCGDTQNRRAISESRDALTNHAKPATAEEATEQRVKARFVNLQAAPS